MTSELKTKNSPEGLSLMMWSLARRIGPAVPMGSYSIEMVILTLYYIIRCLETKDMLAYDIFVCLQAFDECGRDIVHSEDDLSDAGLSQGLDLMAEDRFVTEEDEGLRN